MQLGEKMNIPKLKKLLEAELERLEEMRAESVRTRSIYSTEHHNLGGSILTVKKILGWLE